MKTICILLALTGSTVWATQNENVLMASVLPLFVKPAGSTAATGASPSPALELNKWSQTNNMPKVPNVPGATNWPVTNLPPTTNWPSTNLPAMTNPPVLQPPGGK